MLVDASGAALTVPQIAAKARTQKGESYDPEGGGFKQGIAVLRRLELVEETPNGLRAVPELLA